MRGRLEWGQLRAHVPDAAHGFTIGAPGVAVVDLGTQFRMAVDGRGTRVEVTQGRVRLDRDTGDSLELALGQLATVPADASKPIAVDTARPAHIRQIPIINASFEAPVLGDVAWTGEIAGWERLGPRGNFGVSRFGVEFVERVPDGKQMAFVNEGGIAQELEAKLEAGARYTLSVVVGNRPGAHSPHYALELYAGSEWLAYEANPVVPDKGRFGRATLTYETPADHPAIGQPLRIVLRSIGSLDRQTQNHFDSVSLTAEYRGSTPP
jgi:hypothetical protein